jgi:hypothetical protein
MCERETGHTRCVSESWIPALQLRESAGRCHLSLAGLTYGVGGSLQDAADDLIARLMHIALGARRSGFRHASELGPPDHRLHEFIWEVGELAARGEDIRPRVFGPD